MKDFLLASLPSLLSICLLDLHAKKMPSGPNIQLHKQIIEQIANPEIQIHVPYNADNYNVNWVNNTKHVDTNGYLQNVATKGKWQAMRSVAFYRNSILPNKLPN